MILKSIIFIAVLFTPLTIYAQSPNQSFILSRLVLLIEGIDSNENIYYIRIEPADSDALLELTNLLTNSYPELLFTNAIDVATHEFFFHVDTEISLTRLSGSSYNRLISGNVTLQVTSLSSNIIIHTNRLSIYQEDTISNEHVEDLASPWYPARFHRESDDRKFRFLRRIVEPLAVTSAVLTTVYLLYNVRSS